MTEGDMGVVRTSSYCTNGGCVGVVRTPDGVDVVDTKCSAGDAVLHLSGVSWRNFVTAVKNGSLDPER